MCFGVLTDDSGSIQINLQMGGVLFNNKPPMPVPDELSVSDDFMMLFDYRPQFTVAEDSSYRKWYQASDSAKEGASTYMSWQWQPLVKARCE